MSKVSLALISLQTADGPGAEKAYKAYMLFFFYEKVSYTLLLIRKLVMLLVLDFLKIFGKF